MAKQRKMVSVQGRELELSNLDKVLYPTGFTKAEVLEYYRRISTWMLPHLRGRPLTLKRYPEGATEEYFFEKRCPRYRPDWLPLAPVYQVDGETVNYCAITDLASLMWVANLASLELHLMLSRGANPECPTAVAFDLDPGPPAGIIEAAEIALLLRDVLADLHLQSVVKSSGKKGAHLYVPLNTPVTFDQTKDFARTVARALEGHYGDRITSNMKKILRGGKVLIDWSQNDAHKTTICVYSLRAIEKPMVSAPLRWEEVEAAVKKHDESRLLFDAPQVLERAEEYGDLFEDVLTIRQHLPGLKRAEEAQRSRSACGNRIKTPLPLRERVG